MEYERGREKSIQRFHDANGQDREENDDLFKVTMTTDLDGHHINVIEDADGHTFLDGNGETIEEAVANAIKGIPDALDSWGYEGVTW